MTQLPSDTPTADLSETTLDTLFAVDWAARLGETGLDTLAHDGFLLIDDCFVAPALYALQAESGFIDYRLANLTAGRHARDIRGDRIRWLDETCPYGLAYLRAIERLANWFNATLFTGIRHCEAHYACYPAGFGYQWHTDNPQGRDERVLSAVFYLNDDWHAADGGELVLIDAYGGTQTCQPQANRLLVFNSDLRHQVNTTQRTRYSIATWLRRDVAVV
ncbi:2OG-Fe(II) oxygenase [Faucicola atlantae]|uniref:2OG-Fe(II) oxygenase n=1 Tax=Faucicola atlantae TaxID=34059 RepID=UPI0025AF5CF0|nr:2OG-Fe(II) oxygenase [Moraxella atlantae]